MNTSSSASHADSCTRCTGVEVKSVIFITLCDNVKPDVDVTGFAVPALCIDSAAIVGIK